eukprot:TRINITY_DN23865_c0_g1_i1.p1 TRINITY_DN23865_c0_g1~~TRINITY_DN23865_c0_g1_i1.p1  ORF type:complete len:874 (-),score=174.25 TRINITY_DN23865_c0_g1_i1:75-2657(-)
MVPNGGNHPMGHLDYEPMASKTRVPALTFEVEIRKTPNSRLGVDVLLAKSQNGGLLVVENVSKGGLIEEWNKRSQEPQRVRQGDIIVKANGHKGDVTYLSDLLRSGKGLLRITVLREDNNDCLEFLKAKKQQQQWAAPGAQNQPALQDAPGLSGTLESAVGSMVSLQPHRGYGPQGAGGHAEAAEMWLSQQNGFAQHWGAQAGQGPGLPGGFNQPPGMRGPGPGQPGSMQNQGGLGGPSIPGAQEVPGIAEGFNFEVCLQKPDNAHLGIDVLPDDRSPHLVVKQVREGGVVSAWNYHCRRNAFTIRPGDFIVKVNGISDNISPMMEEMRMREELRITIHRRMGFAKQPGQGQQSPPNQATQGPMKVMGNQFGKAPPRSGPAAVPQAPPPVEVPSSLRLMGSGHAALPGLDSVEGKGHGKAGRGLGGIPTEVQPPHGGCGGSAQDEASMNPGAAAPGGDGKAFTFEVEIEKPVGHRIGIDVMLITGYGICGLLVGQVIKGGYLDRWNQQSQYPRQVQKGDCIISANGVHSWQDLQMMANEFVEDVPKVKFLVQRNASAMQQQERQAGQVQRDQNQTQAGKQQWPQQPGQQADAESAWWSHQGSSGGPPPGYAATASSAVAACPSWAGSSPQQGYRKPGQLDSQPPSRSSLSQALASAALPKPEDGEAPAIQSLGAVARHAPSRAGTTPAAELGDHGPPGSPPAEGAVPAWTSARLSHSLQAMGPPPGLGPPLPGSPLGLAPGFSAPEVSSEMFCRDEEDSADKVAALADAAAAATAAAAAAAVVEDDVDVSPEPSKQEDESRLPSASLLRRTLKVSDEDLVPVLEKALAQRPWLKAPVTQALGFRAAQIAASAAAEGVPAQ